MLLLNTVGVAAEDPAILWHPHREDLAFGAAALVEAVVAALAAWLLQAAQQELTRTAAAVPVVLVQQVQPALQVQQALQSNVALAGVVEHFTPEQVPQVVQAVPVALLVVAAAGVVLGRMQLVPVVSEAWAAAAK